MRQPLSYQMQGCACWITSMMNAAVYLLGGAAKIPNEYGRLLYNLTGDKGTELKYAEAFCLALHDMAKINLSAKVEKKNKVTSAFLKQRLKSGAAIVCDIQGGTHSVLLTGIENTAGQHKGWFKVFDPDWASIHKESGETSAKGWQVCLDEDTTRNVLVSPAAFESVGKSCPFGMWAMGSRCAISLKKES